MKTFSDYERHIKELFSSGRKFKMNDREYEVDFSGKPTCQSGEPKTDIYILAKDCENDNRIEIKISYKKNNADFLENKITAARAEQIFGDIWRDIIIASTENIKEIFAKRYVIYKEKYKKTEKGAITLGWKFEFVNKKSGDLSEKILLTKEQLFDIYAGTKIDAGKKNAYVEGKLIKDSGVANYILMSEDISSIQVIVDNLISIRDYVEEHPDIYFACKALNYRTLKKKYDGDRPLAVQVIWDVVNGKLVHQVRYDKPLEKNGHVVAKILLDCLAELNINNINDINDTNCDMKNVYIKEEEG